MKPKRTMVVVSSNSDRNLEISKVLLQQFNHEIRSHGLSEDIQVNSIADFGMPNQDPSVIVYPEAVVYGPVKPNDVPLIVQSHLIKGEIFSEKVIPELNLRGNTAWIRSRAGWSEAVG